jgi:hypothetical protein
MRPARPPARTTTPRPAITRPPSRAVRVRLDLRPNGTSVRFRYFAYKRRFLRPPPPPRRKPGSKATRLFVHGGDFTAPEPSTVLHPRRGRGHHLLPPDSSARRCAASSIRASTTPSAASPHPPPIHLVGHARRRLGTRRGHLRIDTSSFPPSLDRLKAADADPKTRAGKGVSDHIPCVRA